MNYYGEEDLLAHCLLNFDAASKKHIIGPKGEEKIDGIMIGEGEWHGFIETDLYKNTKKEDRISYFWDELIQRTCQNALNGTRGGNSDLLRDKSAIVEIKGRTAGSAGKVDITWAPRVPSIASKARWRLSCTANKPLAASVVSELPRNRRPRGFTRSENSWRQRPNRRTLSPRVSYAQLLQIYFSVPTTRPS